MSEWQDGEYGGFRFSVLPILTAQQPSRRDDPSASWEFLVRIHRPEADLSIAGSAISFRSGPREQFHDAKGALEAGFKKAFQVIDVGQAERELAGR
ncbi:MAG: hypothetical protein ABSF50_19310 [Burkholderiaceae bacterium]|jgi:hypothetical protein